MRLHMHRSGPRSLALKWLTPLAALLLTACGDPAPGEGVKKPMMSGPPPEVVGAREAVGTPDIPTIDPQTLDAAEIEKVLVAGPRCLFAYTAESPPVVALRVTGDSAGQGVVKVHGRLVKLAAQRADAGGFALSADGMSVKIQPADAGDEARPTELREADMLFELEQGLRVGYRGWYRCTTP
ncbi:V-type H(+)-translocating pyrophosphatase [Pseudomonas sp. MT-1]|nr:V-type H(+)-translocating pyrophosphatase [Pseudomonas sp. MT-1]